MDSLHTNNFKAWIYLFREKQNKWDKLIWIVKQIVCLHVKLEITENFFVGLFSTDFSEKGISVIVSKEEC